MRAFLASLALALCTAALAQAPGRAPADARKWSTLSKDGIHDPASPAMPLRQQPREALSKLPPDNAGNQVNWVEALRNGSINPRTSVRPETVVRLLDTEIVMSPHGSLPPVRFPHLEHTMWLDCSNCHEKLFVSKAGANKISKFSILMGEQCGQCHGAVAFPLTECGRCHNVPRTPAPKPGAAAAR